MTNIADKIMYDNPISLHAAYARAALRLRRYKSIIRIQVSRLGPYSHDLFVRASMWHTRPASLGPKPRDTIGERPLDIGIQTDMVRFAYGLGYEMRILPIDREMWYYI